MNLVCPIRTGRKRNDERGMTLMSVMVVMTIFAVAMLAVAPSVVTEIQREKELEQIRRGEEVAEAIREYVEFYRGAKLPTSMDDLLAGIPFGTKKRQILRPSAAIDPLSPDGKWRLVRPQSQEFINFARNVQKYNNGMLPTSSSRVLDQYALPLVNIVSTNSSDDKKEPEEDTSIDVSTSNTPFIGVASQSKSKSIVTYYGVENHSKWIYTPLFRGGGTMGGAPNRQPPQPVRQSDDSGFEN